MGKKYSILGVLAALTLLFIGLSVWQWMRYNEKLAILANPPPITSIQGQFAPAKTIKLLGRTNGVGVVGYDVITLFTADNGENYITHLGFMANDKVYTPPTGRVTLEYYPQKPHKSPFQPNNNPQKGEFYYVDPMELQQYWGTQLNDIILYSQNSGATYPSPRPFMVLNNHLGYCLTWAGLALVAIFFGAMVIKKLK